MENKIRLLKSVLGDDRVKEKVVLADYVVTKTKIKAACLYIATTTRELLRAIEICEELKINFLLLGSGSKIVLPEEDFAGLAIKNRSDNLKISGVRGKVSREGIGIEEAFLEAESGASLSYLLEFAQKQGLSGLEMFDLMPGTLGGSLVGNLDLQSKVYQVKVLNKEGMVKVKDVLEVQKEDIILSVVYKLKTKS